MKRGDEAVPVLEAGVQDWPTELYAQIELSNALYGLGREKEAASVLETAAKSAKNVTWFLYQPAMTHFQQGRVAACDRLVAQMPLTDTYWGMMQGFILIEKGLLKEAQKFFEGYLDYQGEYAQLLPIAYRALGRIAIYRGDLDGAEAMLSRALESAPVDVLGTHRIYTSVLWLARVKGDEDSFQKYLSKALSYGKTSPWWDWDAFSAAWLRISTGQPRVAEMHLRSAMLVGKYNAREARIMIEVLHFVTGKKDRARSNIQKVLSEISKDHVLQKAKAYLCLSYLDSKTGDMEQSQKNLKKAQDLVPGITADYLRAFDHLAPQI